MRRANAPGLFLHPSVVSTGYGTHQATFHITHRDDETDQISFGSSTWFWPVKVRIFIHEGYKTWALDPHMYLESHMTNADDLREIARNMKRMERMKGDRHVSQVEHVHEHRGAFARNLLGFCRGIGGVWYSKDALTTGQPVTDASEWSQWKRDSDPTKILYALGVCYDKYIATRHAEIAGRTP